MDCTFEQRFTVSAVSKTLFFWVFFHFRTPAETAGCSSLTLSHQASVSCSRQDEGGPEPQTSEWKVFHFKPSTDFTLFTILN